MRGVELEKIRDLLVDCFDENDFMMLLRTRFDIRMKASIQGNTFTMIVFNTLEKAEKEGWLPDLLSAAAKARPKRADVQELSEKYVVDVQPAVKMATPLTFGQRLNRIRRQEELIDVLKLHQSQLMKKLDWKVGNPYLQLHYFMLAGFGSLIVFMIAGLIVSEMLDRNVSVNDDSSPLQFVPGIVGILSGVLCFAYIYARLVTKALRERRGDDTPLNKLIRDYPDFIAQWELHNLSDPRSLPSIIHTEETVLANLRLE